MIYDLPGDDLASVYDIQSSSLEEAYDINGNEVFSRGGHDEDGIEKYRNYTVEMLNYVTPCGQDFAYYDGKFVAATSTNDVLRIIDAQTGARLADAFTVENLGHCNSLVFSDDFYILNDTFPLLCTTNTNTGLEYYRIANTYDSAEMVKKYLLETPLVDTNTVWYGLGFDSGYFYTIGYTSGSYQWSSNNFIILAKYDLQNPIDNGDETYTLPLLYAKRREWFECIQGTEVHDGYFWVTSGFTNPSHIYAIDLVTAEILLDIPMEDYSTYEIEALSWKNNYTLIVGLKNSGSNTGMFTITFPDLIPPYLGKTLSVLGDSISAYSGTIPQGNASYYTGQECGVSSVDQMWWKRLITSLGMTLNVNNAWSGARVTTTNGVDSAGVTRASNLGVSPDVIIVFMGINDFNNEVDLGTYINGEPIPETDTTFCDAYAKMIDIIQTTYPDSEIWCSTLLICERNGSIGSPPEINDAGVQLETYNTAIKQIASDMGVRILDLFECGITYDNMSTYMGDWTSLGKALHPNAEGHQLIAEYAEGQLLASKSI